MIKYIILNSEQEAVALNKKLTNLCVETWVDGVTLNYCDIKKHPTDNKWAVIVDDRYIEKFTQEEVNSSIELSEDWKEQIKQKT